MVDWSAHYAAIYNALGVSATITLADSGDTVSATVIDKTGGITVQERQGGVAVDTLRPAAAVRVSDLDGASTADLNGSDITFNGGTWRIESHIPRPSPIGEGGGEIYLVLVEKPS